MTQKTSPKPEPQAAPEPDESAPPAEPDASETPRKERVIHTRVPAVLETELKRMAAALRVPVSNVVRTILEDAVEAMDRVGRKAEGEVRGIAERLAHNRDRLRGLALGADAGRGEDRAEGARAGESSEPVETEAQARARIVLDGVIGFQPLVLAQGAQCAVCGLELVAGDDAYLGVRAAEGPAVIIGPECLPARRAPGETESA